MRAGVVPWRRAGGLVLLATAWWAAGAHGQEGPAEPGAFSAQPTVVTGGRAKQVWSVAFSPDGATLAVASGHDGGDRNGPGRLDLYDVASRRRLARVNHTAG